MEYRPLGNSGLSVPALSFGTATFGGVGFFEAWGTTGVSEARRLVDMAIDAGVTLFDTADVYSDGLSEEVLGKALGTKRAGVLICTKATNRMGGGPNQVGASRHHLIAACEASLRRLAVDHIDLWLMHGFDALTRLEETIRALDDLIAAGKVRYVGCSNYSGWHLMKSLAIADSQGLARFVTHQVYYSLIGREYEWELMPLAVDQGVGAMVWSALAGGLLAGKVGRGRQAHAATRVAAQGGTPSTMPEEQFFSLVETLEMIAADTGRSVAQVALNWTLHRPTVASVVIGARNETQLADNLAAADFRLTADQVARLDAASAMPMIYPYWHQQTVGRERNPPPTPFATG